jgi:hypothetical protein
VSVGGDERERESVHPPPIRILIDSSLVDLCKNFFADK